MNNLVIITNRQKLIICIAAIVFILLSAFLIVSLDFPKVKETGGTKVSSVILTPETENHQLKDIISSILPAQNNVLYENDDRSIANSRLASNSSLVAPSEILAKGKNLSYLFVYSDEDYLRPIYSNQWKQSYYQGWLYLPKKVVSARHTLFTYLGSAGTIFDTDGELGFYPNIAIDNLNYFNFLIYNFELDNIMQLGNQIAISGKPTKKGVQVISIKAEDLAAQINQKENIAIHLCTPKGYELDYQNVLFSREYDEKEDSEPVEDSYMENDIGIADISRQNLILKQELSHYISDSSKPIYFQYSGSYQTSNVLNANVDIEDALSNLYTIRYSMVYDDKKYVRPVFHPQWKEYYDREWCYIPRKMYLNMKKLFVLPSDKNISSDLCGELGFFEKYPDIGENQIGILVNNFSVSKAGTFEDNILLEGTPSRTGIQIVAIDKKYISQYKEYAVRLVTSDFCEMDTDVFKN